MVVEHGLFKPDIQVIPGARDMIKARASKFASLDRRNQILRDLDNHQSLILAIGATGKDGSTTVVEPLATKLVVKVIAGALDVIKAQAQFARQR